MLLSYHLCCKLLFPKTHPDFVDLFLKLDNFWSFIYFSIPTSRQMIHQPEVIILYGHHFPIYLCPIPMPAKDAAILFFFFFTLQHVRDWPGGPFRLIYWLTENAIRLKVPLLSTCTPHPKAALCLYAPVKTKNLFYQGNKLEEFIKNSNLNSAPTYIQQSKIGAVVLLVI